MGYRIEARDLKTGEPVAPYESRTDSEPEARAEAERLGVSIVALTPLVADMAAQIFSDTVTLTNWSESSLHWRPTPWTLARLGFEHPRWSKWLTAPLIVSVGVLRSKVLFKWLAGGVVALLAAIGIQADPVLVLLALVPLMLLGPLLAIKPFVFTLLRRKHARGGFDIDHYLQVDTEQLRYFDGEHEHYVPTAMIVAVHELRHFALVTTRDQIEIAVPTSSFRSPALALAFVQTLAREAGIQPTVRKKEEVEQTRKHRHQVSLPFVFVLIVLLGILAFLFIIAAFD